MAEMLAFAVLAIGGVGLLYNFVAGPVPILSDIGEPPLGAFFILAGLYGYAS